MRLWDVLGLSPSRDKKTPNTERKKGEGKKGQQKKKKTQWLFGYISYFLFLKIENTNNFHIKCSNSYIKNIDLPYILKNDFYNLMK